jgi:ABC-type amino acid transport substrate-binding protein
MTMKNFLSANILFILACSFTFAQDSTLTIGVKEAPPFVQFNAAGNATGLSIDFWDLVDDNLGVSVEYKLYETLQALMDGVQSNEVDLSINPITVTDQRMETMDFSQPFFISGTAMVRTSGNKWLSFFDNLFSKQFFSDVAVLIVVIFIFGFLIWIFERRANPDQFGKGWKGIGDGFWWSAVTMTTVGYGDKAPVSKGGRTIGFIWMFAAILMISGLTASIASALTVSSLESNIESVEDLRKFNVGTIGGSSSSDYLGIFDVEAANYTSVENGLNALENGELDVFVYDRPILRHFMREGDFSDLTIAPENLKTDYYSLSFPKGSPLVDVLNPIIVRELKSSRWNRKLRSMEQ